MSNPEVLLGVTGSIAAYKALELVRLFKRQNWGVTVVMTRAATKLVGVESFRTLTNRAVALKLFPAERHFSAPVEHIDLATSPDLIVVAPATANILGKLASGIGDDLLSTLLLAVPQEKVKAGRVLFAPAMNVNMWHNPIVQANIEKLKATGYCFIEPDQGELACGTIGTGRMAEPAEIFARCRAALESLPDLNGVSVLVTTGRTEEPLDPVRIITNRSSGRMGVEIARAFKAAGARTRLIAGAVSVPLPADAIRVQTTEEMAEAVLRSLPETDILVMCAAVADYQPAKVAKEKYHTADLSLKLVRTPDILSLVAARKEKPFLVGFSLDANLERAKEKLRAKHLDLIIANPPTTAGSERIAAQLLFASGKQERLPEMDKAEFALKLVKTVGQIYKKRKQR
ncbi:bifunctional phosphopantothenoylcysteine decarboxylase/phosphopantothenate--cysteine ligase CoaBC [candidate division WOR-3 bacterium]|nr:bifunctional phosphopantothenoylcysteine decarboxylase/phosphopantothenate--cysteine ligase CoaBC [candidate division WOR-3 bacterium]